MNPWEEEEVHGDSRVWAFDYQARGDTRGAYEKKQITDSSYNIHVRRVKFLKWSQEPDQVNYIGNIGMPYCLPGQPKIEKKFK